MPQTTLTDDVTWGGTPGSPTTGAAATPEQRSPIKADLLRQYVSGQPTLWNANFIRALPWAIDDLSQDFGDDIWDKMLLDGHVRAAINTVKTAVLASGVDLVSAADDETDDTYDLAGTIRDYCERCLRSLTPSLEDTLWNMLDALCYGSKIAEQVYAMGTGEDAGRLVLTRLAVKPRHATAFVVDVYRQVIGILGLIPGQGSSVLVGSILTDPGTMPNLLPREKFAVLTVRPVDGDPRGTSILRPAYTPWNMKVQLIPEYLKFLSIYAAPSLIGFVDPMGPQDEPVLDPSGTPTGAYLTNTEAMTAALTGVRNSMAGAFPAGAKVQLLEAHGEGRAFEQAFDRCNRDIATAILGQTLATGEGQHDSRAAAAVHADVLATIIMQIKQAVAAMLKHDVLMPLVRYNWPEAAVALTPDVSLGETAQEDRAALWAAAAQLVTARFIQPSQYSALYAELGLPPASAEDLARLADSGAAPAAPPTTPEQTPAPPGTALPLPPVPIPVTPARPASPAPQRSA